MPTWQIVLYAMMGCQMIFWAWFTYNGGNLSHRGFLLFSLAMMIGQAGAIAETVLLSAWGTGFAQAYFFCFTGYGAWRRWREMRKPPARSPHLFRVDPDHAAA